MITNAEILRAVDDLKDVIRCGDRTMNTSRKDNDVRVREPTTRGRHEGGYVRIRDEEFCDLVRSRIGEGALTPTVLVEALCALHDRPDDHGATVVHTLVRP